MTDTYGERRGVTPHFQEALKVELNAAYDAGGKDMARHTAMRLKTLEVNASNGRLDADSFRDVAIDILTDVMEELEKIAHN